MPLFAANGEFKRATRAGLESFVFIVRRRIFREDFFCESNSPQNDEKVYDPNWHRIKERRAPSLRPSNHENQWDMER